MHSVLENCTAGVLRRLPTRLAEPLYYRLLCGRSNGSTNAATVVRLRSPNSRHRLHVVRGDVIGDSLFYTGSYEPFTTRRLLEIACNDGGLFVDVGANVGYYSLLWCATRQTNRCLAVEASPRNVSLIEAMLRDNAITDRCQLHPVAASNAAGEVSFDQGPVAQTGWGGISEGVGSGSRVITVPAQRLDELVPQGEQVRLLKIDVEGAEAMVLEGASQLLEARAIQEIWFEDCQSRREQLGISLDRLFQVLRDAGYRVEASTKDRRLPMDYCAYAT